MPTRRRLGLGAAAAALAAPAVLRAQQAPWPNDRPVEVIVPTPPGGGLDAMTRLIMPLVAARIPGLRPVVTSRTGAGGQIGMEATFNAAPDGYTLGATTIPAQNAFPLERAVRYRAMDFTFLANIVEDANCFLLRADSPIRSVADLVEQARARPGRLSYGSTGIGSDDHIFMLAFETATGIPPMVHVPFTGAAPLLPQLAGGHLDLAAMNVNDGAALIREGKLRILAQAAVRRQADAPDVPTFRELGLDIVNGASRGIVGPPGLPAEITGRLERAFAAAMADEGFQREAQRSFMPLRPLVGSAYREMAAGVDAQVRQLWQQRPWRG
jgi:tripartite-type tricarboxylate transporter receptor subunit TctC